MRETRGCSSVCGDSVEVDDHEAGMGLEHVGQQSEAVRGADRGPMVDQSERPET